MSVYLLKKCRGGAVGKGRSESRMSPIKAGLTFYSSAFDIFQNDGVEYFYTIVVQPHRKLVTNQGRGYHIRCRYRTESKTLKSDFDVK